MSRRARWLRWLLLWLGLLLTAGMVESLVFGPLLPPHFIWSSAFVLSTALAFLLGSPPTADE